MQNFGSPSAYTPPAASVFYILLGCHVYRSIFASNSACQILKLSDREEKHKSKQSGRFRIKKERGMQAQAEDKMNRVDVLFFLEKGPSSEYLYSYFSCLLNGERLEVKVMVKMPA